MRLLVNIKLPARCGEEFCVFLINWHTVLERAVEQFILLVIRFCLFGFIGLVGFLAVQGGFPGDFKCGRLRLGGFGRRHLEALALSFSAFSSAALTGGTRRVVAASLR